MTNSVKVTQNRSRSAKRRLSMFRNTPTFGADPLVGLLQICADQAREIRILVCCARKFVDPAALLELAKGNTTGDDKVTLVKQLVTLSVKENSPVPWGTLIARPLRTNTGGTIRGNGIVPARVVA